MLRRSQLYVPSNNRKMIIKASSLPCDSIILDLEDAVPENEKENARNIIKELVPNLRTDKKELCLRINPIKSKHWEKDIELASKIEKINTIVVPKAEGKVSIVKEVSGKNIMPIIETAKGFVNISNILSSEGVDSVTYGSADFASNLKGSLNYYLKSSYVRESIVIHAKSFGIQAIDCVFFDIEDKDNFVLHAKQAKELGYDGKQVIHPSQIEMANMIFSPSKEEIEKAKRIVQEYEKASSIGKGAIKIEGKLVDAVHYRIAKELIEKSS